MCLEQGIEPIRIRRFVLPEYFNLGNWLANKYRKQAKELGTFRAATNMRKQGIPIEFALQILAGKR